MNFLDALSAVRKSARPVGFSKDLSRSIKPVASVIQEYSPSQTARRTENAIREAIVQKEKPLEHKRIRTRP